MGIEWEDTEDRRRTGRHSKHKGDGYEREISKILSKWWGQEESFRRAPRSGAWDRKRAPGDVFCMEHLEKFPFVIETRKNESWKLGDVVMPNPKAGLLSWWLDKKNDHGPESFMWFIFSKNREDHYIMFSCREREKLISIIGNTFFSLPIIPCSTGAGNFDPEHPLNKLRELHITKLKLFLECVPSNKIKDFIVKPVVI